MHKGTVKKLVQDRGFGFINDVDGREIFFHHKSLEGIEMSDIKEGDLLEFEVEKSDKGPRAVKIRKASE